MMITTTILETSDTVENREEEGDNDDFKDYNNDENDLEERKWIEVYNITSKKAKAIRIGSPRPQLVHVIERQ